MIDKKAVSLLISYVLLVSFAIVMGVLVYGWMKSYVPGEGLACPEGTSLFIKDAYCDKDTLKFNLTLENNGRFDIKGFYIHATNSSNQKLATIDLSKKLVPGGTSGGSIIIPSVVGGGDLEPGKTTKEVKFQLSEKIYSIEVTPVRYQGKAGKEKYVSCGDVKVKQEINCGEFDPLSLTGLVSWWRFEENTLDETGRNNGNPFGAWRPGKSGKSAYFDGSSYITVLDDDDSLDITGNISIAVWVNATSGGSLAVDNILYKGAGYMLEATHNIRCGEDRFNLEYGDSGNNVLCSSTIVSRNNWQYLVVTYNKTDALFYINGGGDSPVHKVASTSANSNNLQIGFAVGGSTHFEGQLDELMIFNRTLNQEEITKLYNHLR